jgi:hypothetical protein
VEQTVYEGLYETPDCLITANKTVQPNVLSLSHKLYVIAHKNWPHFKADNTKTTEPEAYKERRTGRKEPKRIKEIKTE